MKICPGNVLSHSEFGTSKPMPKRSSVPKWHFPGLLSEQRQSSVCRAYHSYYKSYQITIQFFLDGNSLDEEVLKARFENYKPFISKMVNSFEILNKW